MATAITTDRNATKSRDLFGRDDALPNWQNLALTKISENIAILNGGFKPLICIGNDTLPSRKKLALTLQFLKTKSATPLQENIVGLQLLK